MFKHIISEAMAGNNYIAEGYGLTPEDALYLANLYKCTAILLSLKTTPALEDFELVRKPMVIS